MKHYGPNTIMYDNIDYARSKLLQWMATNPDSRQITSNTRNDEFRNYQFSNPNIISGM